MSEPLFPLPPDISASVILEVAPLEEEEDDLDTIAIVGQMQASLRLEAAHLEGYVVKSQPDDTRGIDIILLVAIIGTTTAAYKDLITSIFNMVSATVELLAKREHVREIQIIIDGKTVILHDVSKKTAKELIETVEAQYPRASETLVAGKNLKVKAKVSKKSRRR